MLIVLLALWQQSEKTVEVKFTDAGPKIDGFIEEIWQQADSLYDLIQYYPYEKGTPTETTIIYIIQDKNNLYVAFRCYCRLNKPTVYPGFYEDNVTLYIDPMGSKTSAYSFKQQSAVLSRTA